MRGALYTRDYAKFRQRLRAARQEAGLLQEEAATALGRPQSFISKCENGERRVDAVELVYFARLYDRPLSFFLGELDEATARRRPRRRQARPRKR